MRAALAGTVLVLAALGLPAQGEEEPNSCSVVATGIGRGNCRYRADGPGEYVVATTSGFIITAFHADGTAETLASHMGFPDRPHTSLAVQRGPLESTAGDLIDVAIGVASITTPNGPLAYMDGFASAGPASG